MSVDPRCTCQSPCPAGDRVQGNTTYDVVADVCNTPCSTPSGSQVTGHFPAANCALTYGCPLWDGLWRDTGTGAIYLYANNQLRWIRSSSVLTDCYWNCGVYDFSHDALSRCAIGPDITDNCTCPTHPHTVPAFGTGCQTPLRTGCGGGPPPPATCNPACYGGAYCDPNLLSCWCPGNQTWQNNQCADPPGATCTPACYGGAYCDPNLRSCWCPGNQTWQNNQCADPPGATCTPACYGGAYCDPNLRSCWCPGNQTWQNNQCADPPGGPPPPSSTGTGMGATPLLILAAGAVAAVAYLELGPHKQPAAAPRPRAAAFGQPRSRAMRRAY